MWLRQMCWICWVVGTALIVLSWIDVVPAMVGWFGFCVSLVAAGVSYIPQKQDRAAYPLTQEGFPVEPSGAPVPPDLPLEPGTPLLAYSQGKWWRATVVSVEPGDQVVVTYPGWDPNRQERLPRNLLQIDPDPTRAPLRLPPEGWLDRKAPPARPDGVQPNESRDGVRREDR